MAGIGEWDSGYLLRFIRAALTGDPIPPGAVLQVEDVIVKGDVDLSKGRLRQSNAPDGYVLTAQNGTWKALSSQPGIAGPPGATGSTGATGAAGATGATGGARLAYAEYTGNVTISATTEATSDVIATAPAYTFSGSQVVRIEVFIPTMFIAASAAGSNDASVVLFEDGAAIGTVGYLMVFVNESFQAPMTLVRYMTPSAGSHTFSARGFRTNANVTAAGGVGGAGNPMPGYIHITAA